MFSANSTDDVHLTVVVDDMVSSPHEEALSQAGGADSPGISVAPPVGEPALPPHPVDQRVPHDMVRGLQRRADTPPPVSGRDAPAEDDSATARADLAALAVRCVPVFEHPDLLTTALDSTRQRFLLITSHLRDAVITDELLAHMRVMLRRGGLTARIAYGLGCPEGEHDSQALARLASLAGDHSNLTVVRVDDPLPMTQCHVA